MGVQILDVGYTSATTGRGDHEVHKGHVAALGRKQRKLVCNVKSDETSGSIIWGEFLD
jgi:hypothetical protein